MTCLATGAAVNMSQQGQIARSPHVYIMYVHVCPCIYIMYMDIHICSTCFIIHICPYIYIYIYIHHVRTWT